MNEQDDSIRQQGRQDLTGNSGMGPMCLLWESSLERLKILNYEKEFCVKFNRKQFSKVHFVVANSNSSRQFDEFVSLCSWLACVITKKNDAFKTDDLDDPNTIINKLMLVLRQFDFRSTFSAQKLRVAYGEPVCIVLDFLTDKALDSAGCIWNNPIYMDSSSGALEESDDGVAGEVIEDDDDVHDNFDEGIVSEESALVDASVDASLHNILIAAVDPVEWKTELERVGPKLRSSYHTTSTEWRSHVNQTLTNKQNIEKAVSETQFDLHLLFKHMGDDLSKMKMKEKYLSNQYNSLGLEYVEVKHKLEDLESKCNIAHETVVKLTNDLAELSEKLDDLKDSFESKDSGLHDTSPLIKVKSALQQVKTEIHAFDMRIGVVSHSLLSARTNDSNRLRTIALSKSRQRHRKSKTTADDSSLLSEN